MTKIIRPVLDGNADMCVAGFNKKAGDGGFGIVKKTAAKGIAMLTGCKFDWPLSGQRAMRMDCLEKVAPVAGGFGVEVALTIDWMQAGFFHKGSAHGHDPQGPGQDVFGILSPWHPVRKRGQGDSSKACETQRGKACGVRPRFLAVEMGVLI